MSILNYGKDLVHKAVYALGTRLSENKDFMFAFLLAHICSQY